MGLGSLWFVENTVWAAIQCLTDNLPAHDLFSLPTVLYEPLHRVDFFKTQREMDIIKVGVEGGRHNAET